MLGEQMDIFDLIEKPKPPPPLHTLPAPGLFGSPARGLLEREEVWQQWKRDHGHFDSISRSHAWHEAPAHAPSWGPTEDHLTGVLSCDLRCNCPVPVWRGIALEPRPGMCSCVGADLLYRAACTCGWEGPVREDENHASEDVVDHLWGPGWRELPAVPKPPEDKKLMPRWIAAVNALYPTGWLEAGGPIRTERGPMGRRHVPGRSGFGGYDLAHEEPPAVDVVAGEVA